jgi:hypothetical protein
MIRPKSTPPFKESHPNPRRKKKAGDGGLSKEKAVQKWHILKITDIYIVKSTSAAVVSIHIGALLLISPSFTYLPKVYNKRAKEQAYRLRPKS